MEKDDPELVAERYMKKLENDFKNEGVNLMNLQKADTVIFEYTKFYDK